MKARLREACLVLCCLCFWAGEARADDYDTDEFGQRTRVRFQPSSELRLGWLGGMIDRSGTRATASVVESGVSYRGESISGRVGNQIRWTLYNRVAWGTVNTTGKGSYEIPVLDATLYSGTYMRHADESYAMLPTNPPRRLYFPFDIGVDTQVGTIRSARTPSGNDSLRIGVTRATILIDPVRASSSGRGIEIGVSARYDVDLNGGDSIQNAVKVHRLAPFTAPTLRWRWQLDSGLANAELFGTWFPHWSSEGHWSTNALETRARVERVVLAFNDEPISLVIDGSYQRFPSSNGTESWSEAKLLAGVRVGVQLK